MPLVHLPGHFDFDIMGQRMCHLESAAPHSEKNKLDLWSCFKIMLKGSGPFYLSFVVWTACRQVVGMRECQAAKRAKDPAWEARAWTERSTRVTCQKVWQGYTLVDGHEGQGSFQRQRERKRWRGEDHPSVSVTTVVFLDTSRSLTLDLLEAQLE